MIKGLVVILVSMLTLFRPVWTVRKDNRVLQKDNDRLRCELDSLRQLHQSVLTSMDSLRNVIDECAQSDEEKTDFEFSDSLLHQWILNQEQAFSLSYDMENEVFDSDVPDSEFAARLEAINSRIPLAYNAVVRNYCILYSEKSREIMNNVLGLCEAYWPIFDEVFLHYDIPLEMKALAIVESHLKPTAYSRMGAKGIWQFMYRTARSYGLRIDSWTDERMDPFKSTEAAAKYMKEAYEVFGDWNLAMASYNCGQGNVAKAIRRSGGKRDLWEIYEYLPRETRTYVPAFTGALYACCYYKEHGIVPVSKSVSVPVDTFHIRKNLHFGQIAAVTGADSATVAALNPQYYHGMIPGNEYECVLRLPASCSTGFIDAGDSLYVYEHEKYLGDLAIKKMKEASPYGSGDYVIHKVKSGEVLGKIARKYGVSVNQIKKWNNLNTNIIQIGQKLRIFPRR